MDPNPRERIVELTADSPYPRDRVGRPLVPAEWLERMRKVTTEEAWGVLSGHDYRLQFEGDWVRLKPQQILVGRAVTCRLVPLRPDVRDAVAGPAAAGGPAGDPCRRVVDTLEEGDVLVVEASGQVAGATVIDHALGGAVERRGGTGLVVDGGIRDLQRLAELPLAIFCRGAHPGPADGVALVATNGPVRIGHATALPGDVVLGTPTGVIFVPPRWVEEVVDKSEETRLRDCFGKLRIREGVYTPGEVDRAWSEAMAADYGRWRAAVNPDDLDL